jgi:hypothetical protein
VVDAYIAQHPGDGSDRRDRRSVFVHLVGLCATLEHDLPHTHVTKLLGDVIRQSHGDFPVLERTEVPGPLTVMRMIGAPDLTDMNSGPANGPRQCWVPGARTTT